LKDMLGTINYPVVVGGELIAPGDIISIDDDGVVVYHGIDRYRRMLIVRLQSGSSAAQRASVAEFAVCENPFREHCACSPDPIAFPLR
jgi:regulator of RNase E activity RraA